MIKLISLSSERLNVAPVVIASNRPVFCLSMKGDDKELRVRKMTEKLAARFCSRIRSKVTQTKYRDKMRKGQAQKYCRRRR